MNRRSLLSLIALLSLLASPFWLRAQATHHHYVAIDLGTLGGPNSSGCVPDCRYVNNLGSVIFRADTAKPDPFASDSNDVFGDGNLELGVVWQNGVSIPLNGVPRGYNSFPYWLSDSGLVAGLAENGKIDPTTSSPEAIATLWLSGFPITLGTLGGNASAASSVNNIGQVVGGAANRVEDAFAGAFYNYSPLWFQPSTETHAFLWQAGFIRDLGTLGGTDSVGSVINQTGKVAGSSFTDTNVNETTGMPTMHPFLWEGGAMKDLGSLGGTVAAATFLNDNGQVIGYSNLAGDAIYHPFLWNSKGMSDLGTLGGNNGEAIWINNAGQLVGRADLPGSQAHHAFLWQNGEMTDLGTVDGDPCSTAYGVNSLGQVVGDSGNDHICPGTAHPLLWENGGPAVDVNTLYPPFASGLTLGGLCCINDLGEMFGTGSLPNGDSHGMLIVPCDHNHPNLKGCDYALVTSEESESSASVDSARPTIASGDSDRLKPFQSGGQNQ